MIASKYIKKGSGRTKHIFVVEYNPLTEMLWIKIINNYDSPPYIDENPPFHESAVIEIPMEDWMRMMKELKI